MTNKQRDILSSALFLIFGAGMFFLSLGIKHRIPSDVGSAYVPKFIAICIMIVAGAKLILSLMDKSASGKKKEGVEFDKLGGIGTVVLMFAYMLALEPVGFIVSSVLYLFLQILLMSNKDNRNIPLFAIISVLLPIGISALFYYVIKMPLPKGIIGF